MADFPLMSVAFIFGLIKTEQGAVMGEPIEQMENYWSSTGLHSSYFEAMSIIAKALRLEHNVSLFQRMVNIAKASEDLFTGE
jgi:hypothetical protein